MLAPVHVNMGYHDAAAQVVEDGRLQFEVLPPDDGVGQGELQEEGLEDGDLLTGGQAETMGGQTESLRLPGGDGVWDGEGHVLHSGVSETTDRRSRHDVARWFLDVLKPTFSHFGSRHFVFFATT